MKITDYSKIAKFYDDNEIRTNIPIDKDLKEYLDSINIQGCNVLDVACGTGNYLKVQTHAFGYYKINWFALDFSEEMLKIAKDKVENVNYIKANADKELPYENAQFNYIVNNFAFHHFKDKSKFLDEIYRVLKIGGVFKMENVAPQSIENSSIYKYFPNSFYEDQKRFWSESLIFYELESRGFSVKIDINTSISRVNLKKVLDMVINRDISQVAIISEKHYEDGISKIKMELDKDPNNTVINETTAMTCIAKKL